MKIMAVLAALIVGCIVGSLIFSKNERVRRFLSDWMVILLAILIGIVVLMIFTSTFRGLIE